MNPSGFISLRPRPVWTVERDEQLRRLFSDGLCATQVAIELRCTKNSLIGHCWRDGIRWSGSRGPLDRKAEPTTNPFPAPTGCLWPYDDPDNPNFHFCGAERFPGKPYCPVHAAIAFVPRPPEAA
jgi:GcrA cell cycle regulator